MGGPKDEELNYAYVDYRGGRYRGNYYDAKTTVIHDDSEVKDGEAKKEVESSSSKQTKSDPPPLKAYKPKIPYPQRLHKEKIEERYAKLTYNPPVNPDAKTTVIHDDSEVKDGEAKKEVESSSSKQTKSDPPPLKAYKPKIPYPQRLHKEKIEERYAKFIDLIKEVKINVPLVDVLAGMPNYGKFMKDLLRNKSKIEQILAAFLNEECFAIVQNKLTYKLGDPRSFLIPCTVAGSVEYLALAELGVNVNQMPYSLYASLLENSLKPTRMNVIEEVTEEELDALLDDSKPYSTTSEKISKSFLDHEFKEFMAV
nr:reverse transcriptase domain-containing protein [Tanacetum cinerariifolium]